MTLRRYRWGVSSSRPTKRLSPEERRVLAQAVDRAELDHQAWAGCRAHVFDRADYRCEVTLQGVRCRSRACDGHHVKERSQGGEDVPDNVVAVCRFHHEAVDWPYKRGRLVITALGGERFTYAVETAPSKFARRGQGA